jgi:hypothetical protein
MTFRKYTIINGKTTMVYIEFHHPILTISNRYITLIRSMTYSCRQLQIWRIIWINYPMMMTRTIITDDKAADDDDDDDGDHNFDVDDEGETRSECSNRSILEMAFSDVGDCMVELEQSWRQIWSSFMLREKDIAAIVHRIDNTLKQFDDTTVVSLHASHRHRQTLKSRAKDECEI